MIRVLVIEDDTDLLDDIVFGLRHEGFEANGLPDGSRISSTLDERPADVLVLDLGLPGEDGNAIARRMITHYPNLGIVMLTGRDGVSDRILGMESGADIYLSKTTERRELVAAIRAVSRRVSRLPDVKARFVLDPTRCVLCSPENKEIQLTNKEVQLLCVFAGSYGGEATRRQLIEGMGASWMDFDQRRLETLISRLRRKITAETGIDNAIRSMRGDGYLFNYPLR